MLDLDKCADILVEAGFLQRGRKASVLNFFHVPHGLAADELASYLGGPWRRNLLSEIRLTSNESDPPTTATSGSGSAARPTAQDLPKQNARERQVGDRVRWEAGGQRAWDQQTRPSVQTLLFIDTADGPGEFSQSAPLRPKVLEPIAARPPPIGLTPRPLWEMTLFVTDATDQPADKGNTTIPTKGLPMIAFPVSRAAPPTKIPTVVDACCPFLATVEFVTVSAPVPQ